MVKNLKFLLRKQNSTNKNGKKIENVRVDGSNRVWIKLYDFSKEILFDENFDEIVLGGKAIEPLLSYCINEWNVMLPFITYKFNKPQCEAYVESIKYDGVAYEKENV